MPGEFRMLGSHPSYARGARNQVQQFRPETIAEVEFRRRMEIVRGISEHWQGTVGAAACNRPPRPLPRGGLVAHLERALSHHAHVQHVGAELLDVVHLGSRVRVRVGVGVRVGVRVEVGIRFRVRTS